jgi:hypothetical protein
MNEVAALAEVAAFALGFATAWFIKERNWIAAACFGLVGVANVAAAFMGF